MEPDPPKPGLSDEAASRISALAWQFAGHRVLVVAAQTGLLGRLAAGPGRLDALAEGLDPLAVSKVIRALTALGIARAEGDLYSLDPALAPAFQGDALDQTSYLIHAGATSDFWSATLEEWVRTGTSPPRRRSEAEQRVFSGAMVAASALVAPRALDALDLRGVRRVLDVGGGFGAWARACCDRAPGARARVLDRPGVLALAGDPDPRIELRGCDYHTEDWEEGWDLVIFSSILHLESAAGCAALLRRAAASLAPGGRALVIDLRIDDEKRADAMGALFAVNMRSFGDTWSEPELRAWMREAGLIDVQRVDLPTSRWMFVGSKPGKS